MDQDLNPDLSNFKACGFPRLPHHLTCRKFWHPLVALIIVFLKRNVLGPLPGIGPLAGNAACLLHCIY